MFYPALICYNTIIRIFKTFDYRVAALSNLYLTATKNESLFKFKINWTICTIILDARKDAIFDFDTIIHKNFENRNI